MTPLAERIKQSLEEELVRMENNWFFKWHHIGASSGVEIDDFRGGKIRYAGLKFTGTPVRVYWQTISDYLKKKIGQLMIELEVQIQEYASIQTRRNALNECGPFIRIFADSIRRLAVKTDQVLRGNGCEFPPEHDYGRWGGTYSKDIATRISTLTEIYCDQEDEYLVLLKTMTDKISLVKANGTVVKDNIKARVSKDKIITFDTALPVQVGDHILRTLSNGLVDDFIVLDPGFHSAAGTFKAHFQIQVQRSDQPTASSTQVVKHITQVFQGDHVRVYNDNAIDNSNNVTTIKNTGIDLQQLRTFIDELQLNLQSLPEATRTQIVIPLEKLNQEVNLGLPDQNRAKSFIQSIKNIAENAAGGIITSGIVSMAAAALTAFVT